MGIKTSRVHGFYKKTHAERLRIIEAFADLTSDEVSLLKGFAALDFDSANRMVENVISVMSIPLGVAPHFLINDKEYFVPMAIEESSVIAAASHAAKLAYDGGGFFTSCSEPIMIGQIQLKHVPDTKKAIADILAHKQELLAFANKADPILIGVGGGARDIECCCLDSARGPMVVVHLLVNVCDAMGANIVNTMGEKITSDLERLSGGVAGVRIVSNLAVHRMVHAQATWKKKILGADTIEEILDVYELATIDPFRCATHNKGVMNGIDAVAIATGNDFRALEAGAHAYAAISGHCRSLTHFSKNEKGDLVGKISLPLAVGIVGGATQSNPIAKICLKILHVSSASELASVIAAVGLAQNFAAMRALGTEGISKGHMKLHSKNIAIAAGASKKQVDDIAQRMIEENDISVTKAQELLKRIG